MPCEAGIVILTFHQYSILILGWYWVDSHGHPQLMCLQSPCVVYIRNVYTQPRVQACKKVVKICRLAVHFNF